MLTAAKALLASNPDPSREEVIDAIAATSAAAPATSRSSSHPVRRPGHARAAALVKEATVMEFRKDLFQNERDDNLNVVGKGVQRQDMPGHVTGRSPFFDDHAFEGLLHLKVVRSPHHHARIRRIDISAAERAPGVKRILRGADVPVNRNTLLSLSISARMTSRAWRWTRCATRASRLSRSSPKPRRRRWPRALW